MHKYLQSSLDKQIHIEFPENFVILLFPQKHQSTFKSQKAHRLR